MGIAYLVCNFFIFILCLLVISLQKFYSFGGYFFLCLNFEAMIFFFFLGIEESKCIWVRIINFYCFGFLINLRVGI